MLSKQDIRKLRPWTRGGKAFFFVFSFLLMILLSWIDIQNYFSPDTFPTRTEVKVYKYYPYPNVYVCGTMSITRLILSITDMTTGLSDDALVASLNPYIQPLPAAVIPNFGDWNLVQCYSFLLSELQKAGERVVTLRAENKNSQTGFFLVGLYPESNVDWKVVPYSFSSPGKAWFSFQRIERKFLDPRRDFVEYDYVSQSHAVLKTNGNTSTVVGEIHLFPSSFSKNTVVIKELNKINIINLFSNIGGYLTLFNILFYLIWGGRRLRAQGLVQWLASKRTCDMKHKESASRVSSSRFSNLPITRPVSQMQPSKRCPGDSSGVVDREVDIEISRRLKIVENIVAKNYIIGFRLDDDDITCKSPKEHSSRII